MKGNQHMATNTRPFLMTGAALASAAAIVAGTPYLMSSVTTPTTLALSQAQFEMTGFAELLALTPTDVADAFFQGYGGLVGNQEGLDNDPYADASWNIWAPGCAGEAGDPGNCYIAGLSGVAYQALDALINGGTDNVNALNYFYEAGFSAGSEYLLQSSFGAANPILSTIIQLAFLGPALVTQVWNTAWATAASLINVVPVVGPVIAEEIDAYLNGYGEVPPGLSAVLAYTVDLIAGILPGSTAATSAAALAAPAAAAAAATAPVTRALKAAAAKAEVAPAAASEVSAEKAAVDTTVADNVKADETGTEVKADAGTEAPGSDSVKPDASETAAVETPAAGQTETATEAPAPKADTAPKTRKRPIRAAVEKVTTGISDALKGAAGTGAAGSAADAG